jgi:uncharacterized membrane protein
MLPLHIAAGLLGLSAGAVALHALKGGRLHRQSGMVFVYAMLAMSASGTVLAALKPQRLTVVAAVLTAYLVITALLTVRRPARGARFADAAALLVVLSAGVAGVALGFEALGSATGTIDGLPAAPGFLFGGVALLAAVGDIRRMLGRGLDGTQRVARHLWRMCVALFLGTAVSKATTQLLLAIPVILVLSLMLYWLARVSSVKRPARPSRSLRLIPSLR